MTAPSMTPIYDSLKVDYEIDRALAEAWEQEPAPELHAPDSNPVVTASVLGVGWLAIGGLILAVIL